MAQVTAPLPSAGAGKTIRKQPIPNDCVLRFPGHRSATRPPWQERGDRDRGEEAEHEEEEEEEAGHEGKGG